MLRTGLASMREKPRLSERTLETRCAWADRDRESIDVQEACLRIMIADPR